MNVEKSCPKCKTGTMKKRSGRNGDFFGCSAFPKCRHTENFTFNEKPVFIDLSKFQLSGYQQAVLDQFKQSNDNLIVKAAAGSGKTFTLRVLAQQIENNSNALYATFDNRSVKSIKKQLPPHISASTWHSFGYRQIRNVYPDVKVVTDKNKKIFYDILENDYDFPYNEILKENFSEILSLVSRAKNIMTTNFRGLALAAEIIFSGSEPLCIEVAEKIYKRSLSTVDKEIDFDDMIFVPASGMVNIHREYDTILCDESQDLNPAQIELVQGAGNRMIIVGDANQAIYLFRGADSTSMDRLQNHFNAKSLPLSISYRNPLSHVEYVNSRFPEIAHEPYSDAIQGRVDEIQSNMFLSAVKPADLVLCRVNAPLVPLAFQLIGNGVPAYVAGREIGKGLISLLRKARKKSRNPDDMISVMQSVEKMTNEQIEKLRKLNRGASYTEDQRDVMLAIAQQSNDLYDMERKINDLFSNDRPGVKLSTVHKAKGSEADNVFIVSPELMPLPKGNPQEERNIAYVAYTRGKNNLTFVNGKVA